MQSNKFIDQIRRSASGSVLSHFGPTHLKQMCFLCPDSSIVEEFESIITSIEKKKLCLTRENSFLKSIRDTLLPKLISGELRIPDAEKMIEEVGI